MENDHENLLCHRDFAVVSFSKKQCSKFANLFLWLQVVVNSGLSRSHFLKDKKYFCLCGNDGVLTISKRVFFVFLGGDISFNEENILHANFSNNLCIIWRQE